LVGLHEASKVVQPGQMVVIDSAAGELIVDPDEELLARVARSADDHQPAAHTDADRRRLAATADGVRIRLDANIEFPEDLAAARYAGAEGIGLYRSEFLLTARQGAASEDEQYAVYRNMVEGMAPAPVTVRTFDVDEDQLARRSAGSALGGS